MSYIIFEGNTYTFGATVSANPGTGTTSYVFGGLTVGSTYGFIIWAFNGFGFSNIVGPVTYTTLYEVPLETRDSINAFSWSYQHTPSFNIDTYDNGGNTYNLFTASELLGNSLYWTWQNIAGATRISGFTAPDGSTTAWSISVPPNASSKSFNQTRFLDQGFTYIMSFYYDLSNSAGLNLLRRPGSEWTQIDSTTGAILGSTTDTFVTIPVGATGWFRFNYVYYHTFFTRQKSMILLQFGGTGVTVNNIIWGPQLQKVTG